jgi:hypothetical protein
MTRGTDPDLAIAILLEALTFRALILGVTARDLYHAGQIQLLKRLQREEAGS